MDNSMYRIIIYAYVVGFPSKKFSTLGRGLLATFLKFHTFQKYAMYNIFYKIFLGDCDYFYSKPKTFEWTIWKSRRNSN